METTPDFKNRLDVLKGLLSSGVAGTQDEIREKLENEGFEVTQSTVSRDLRRLGAVKATDELGRTVYRFDGDAAPPVRASLSDLILNVQSNGSIIVLSTTIGSASLVARHLDHYKPGGLLGTIAGDDTIFVAPSSAKAIAGTIEAIRASFSTES